MKKSLLIAGALIIGAATANAQCTDWVQPAPDGGWTDFDPAPCNGEFQEIEAFEVFASEAYLMEGIMTGGVYTFSNCNGPGAGTFVNDYTIIAPSGAVDAFGAGDGDGCSITWTATEDGVYTIAINEEGNCGVEGAVGNGWPKMMTVSGGAECGTPPVYIDGAESFEGEGLPDCWSSMDEDGDGNDWNQLEDETLAFHGTKAIRSESFINPDQILTPDNYLITPKLDLGSGEDSLYYVVKSLDANFAAENYTVLVSTSGTDIADFTDEVFTEVLAGDAWEARTIDMSAYADQSIYIAFRHHNSTDMFAFLLDAVALPGTVDCTPDAVFNAEALENISIYPNPSNGLFNVLNSGASDQYIVRVFDITGKQVSEEKVQLNTGSQYQIDLNASADGIYTVQFVSPANTGTLRIVKN